MPQKGSERFAIVRFVVIALVGLFGMNDALRAANLAFLHDTPMAYVTQSDLTSIEHTIDDVLNTKPDGQASNWKSGPRNGVPVAAVLTPEATHPQGQQTCRTVLVKLEAKGQEMLLRPLYCRQGQGEWQLQKRN
ncbi:hypothetical protein EVC45_20770 [Paraburkholderia sp. UYCP14C]|uniref:hypothetical protein n=1 Tax=Paraburkholderia sp. UYCP14C TaxID=2511130 RepID=UPI0010204355|nr:hypothetical protein [Paraburkholderia sp. UYCP14C]RZF27919.1 hypothetical protein EVC45_20770 [Paraburkholderia sp. UYCP14C]